MIATRTVFIDGPGGRLDEVATYHASTRHARRLGWKPGTTHYGRIGGHRYVFMDGATMGEPCTTSKQAK